MGQKPTLLSVYTGLKLLGPIDIGITACGVPRKRSPRSRLRWSSGKGRPGFVVRRIGQRRWIFRSARYRTVTLTSMLDRPDPLASLPVIVNTKASVPRYPGLD